MEIARLCLLILNEHHSELDGMPDDAMLRRWCKSAGFRLKAAADQHAAMTDELDALCSNGANRFDPDQLWTLVRAVKVQSQILDLYTDAPAWL